MSPGDTVSDDKENDEVDADHDAREGRPSVGQDAVIHDGVPVLSSQHLKTPKHMLQTKPETPSNEILLLMN